MIELHGAVGVVLTSTTDADAAGKREHTDGHGNPTQRAIDLRASWPVPRRRRLSSCRGKNQKLASTAAAQAALDLLVAEAEGRTT